MLLGNPVKGSTPGGISDPSTPRRKTSSIDSSKSSPNFSPEKKDAVAASTDQGRGKETMTTSKRNNPVGKQSSVRSLDESVLRGQSLRNEKSTAAALAALEEMQQITKEQAEIAIDLTKGRWESIGIEQSDEDKDDLHTAEACINRVTALFWIRLVAIGIVNSPTAFQQYCSLPLHDDDDHHHHQQPCRNTNMLYHTVDLSTTTLCRKILQSPKEQPRNPQDVDDTERINEEDNINIHQHPDNEQRKTPSPVTKIQTSGPFKVPCWWWPNETNESVDTISQDSSKYPDDAKEHPSSGTTSVDTNASKFSKSNRSSTSTTIQPWEIFVQLRLFVQRILQHHHLNDLPFHNYTHATSVVLRCNKLLDMMLCTIDESQSSVSDPLAGGSGDDNNSNNTGFRQRSRNLDHIGSSDNEIQSISHNNSLTNLSVSNSLNSNNNNMYNATHPAVPADMNYYYGDDSHRYDEDFDLDGRRFPPTFGIRRDPIVQFALLFAGLIHDVEHQGVTNRQLCNEEHPLAILYNDQSVQEKNSLRIAFEEFLKPNYEKLRLVMFGGEPTENATSSKNPKYRHFRQTIVHSVLSTDIASPEQTVITKSKWKEAFYAYNARLSAFQYYEDNTRRFVSNEEQQLPLHGNFSAVMQQYKVPLTAMSGRRRGSLVSEISMPQMSRKYYPQPATDPTAYITNWKPGPVFNRRGSNVSGITEVTDDSYFRNQRQYTSRRGSATGRQYMSGAYRTRGSMTGALQTVPSQRQLDTQLAHEDEYDTSAYVESGEIQPQHIKMYEQLPPAVASVKYIPGVAGRRGSYLSTYSIDSLVLMHQQQHHAHNKGRRLSMTQKFQQQQMRRMSSDDSNSFLYPSRASTDGQSGPHLLHSRRSSNESFQQYLHRRASNESVGGQQYLMNNASNDVDEYSYEGSEFGNDSAVLYNRKANLHGSGLRLNRRMSNGSADSYSASEWGGDSVARRVPVGQDTDDDNEGVIQHRRYPHPEFQSDSNLPEPTTLNTRQAHRSFSLDASSAGTFNSLLANSIEVNKKRLDDDLPDATNTEVKMHSVKKIMMETDDGDAIDISRYLWSEDNDGSMSITPPSSVEDEYGGYAAEYAARFKSPHLAQHTPDDSIPNLEQQQIPKNSSHQDSSNGEYCGRVIVATTTTDKPIDRRSSVSGAITSSSHYLTSNYGNPTIPSADSSEVATGNAVGMNQPPNTKRRIFNRRASTGTVPLRSLGAVPIQQGGRIDENSRMSYGHSLRVNGNGRLRRGSMGTITSNDYPSSTVAHHSQESESALSPNVRNFKKRLGIRRSMDLSGESIEFYPRHEESDIMSVVTDDEMMIQWVDFDETDDLRAAVVIEALLRVADVGHSLQNWESMIMWSTKLFHELCTANENGRGHDPRAGWYDNQIRIMDSYLRPLALQLDEMGVFGEFNGILFVQCVDKIRKRWVLDGQAATETLCEEAETRKANSAIDMMRFL